jgi:mRNA-degrading endonuclease RelE of RelBE toxin-antitoxin system
MKSNIIVLESFKKNAKRLLKKYLSLKDELQELQQQLLQNARMGIQIKENVYKIRLAVKSKGKGKSGGVRIISCICQISINIDENTTEEYNNIYLLTIFDKSEVQNITDKELAELLIDAEIELQKELSQKDTIATANESDEALQNNTDDNKGE